MSRRALSSLLFALALPSAALAQDDPIEPKDEAPAEEGAKEEKPAETAPAPVAAPSNAPFPRISDDQETIYAVQRKAFLVNSAVELTLMGSASFADRFVQSFGVAGAGTYHLAENFGLQVFGLFMFPSDSGLTDEILEEGMLTPEVAKLTQMLWAGGLGAEWSPIYGKIELFGASLGNFNFFVNIGAGLGQTRVQCVRGTDLDDKQFGAGAKCPPGTPELGPRDDVYEPSRLQLMTAIGGGTRFYFNNTLGLMFEVKDWIFPARVYRPGTQEPTQRFTDAIRNNVFVQLGVSFLLGGEE
jgi:outer membrane beta-barrel protein